MKKIINFNREWHFSKEISDISKGLLNNREVIDLPHTWNNEDGQDGGDDYYRGTAYYSKKIVRAQLPENEQYYLEFKGVSASADVYIDGRFAAHHDGGYSTWRVNITDYLADENMLVVKADNGKNDAVYPQMADFTFYGGIYRDVNIVAVNHSHFDLDYCGTPGIKVTPVISGKDAETEIEVFVTNREADQKLTYKIIDREGGVIYEKTCPASVLKTEYTIQNVHLWDGTADPYLYTALVSLEKEGEVIDSVSAKFGCRSFEIDADRGFILNGREYPLRGVAKHQDREKIGNALDKAHHREDMDLICEMGANTIRLAHYQYDQYFYDLCDERGIIVWSEIPYISRHMPGAQENTVSQMKELIVQNYNHPSIVVWGLSNEITIEKSDTESLLENHRVLNDLAHRMDKTRPTTVAAVTMCDTNHPYLKIPDLIAYNHYFGWYMGNVSENGKWLDDFRKNHPGVPIGLSEYGCEALNYHSSNPQSGDYTEEYQAYYHEEMIKQISERPYLWATYVWNMFDFAADMRDEGGVKGRNNKGLVTFDRKYKKDSFYAYKAWLSKEPFVHICGKRYVNRAEDVTKVTVYSNLPKVELFANDKSLGVQEGKYFFHFDVPVAGETVLRAAAGGKTDTSRICKADKPDESYILKSGGAVLNWFDITQIEGYFSLNDAIGDLVDNEEANKLFENLIDHIINNSDENAAEKFSDYETKLDFARAFTIPKLLGLRGVSIPKEVLLELNSRLNKIKK